jgi:3-hydroxybutyryl-CoA dehydrogenase
MKLVEITMGKNTSQKTIQTVTDVAHKMGKETVLVKKDSPAFIVNRILLPALNEAANIYREGIADKKDIDTAIKLALNWPMGPLMLIDYIGVDTVLAIAEILEKELPNNFQASEYLKQLVKTNRLGRKTGQGFYEWPIKRQKGSLNLVCAEPVEKCLLDCPEPSVRIRQLEAMRNDPNST